jgi:lipid A 3-O-deacylase
MARRFVQRVAAPLLACLTAAGATATYAQSGWPRVGVSWFGGLNEGRIVAAGLQWRWQERPLWADDATSRWSWYPELQLQGWRMRDREGRRDTSAVIGGIAFVRWSPEGSRAWFVDAGLGAFRLGRRDAFESRPTGTSWVFSEQIGVGRRLGSGQLGELRAGVAHFSNASMRKPNPGYDFVQLQWSTGF